MLSILYCYHHQDHAVMVLSLAQSLGMEGTAFISKYRLLRHKLSISPRSGDVLTGKMQNVWSYFNIQVQLIHLITADICRQLSTCSITSFEGFVRNQRFGPQSRRFTNSLYDKENMVAALRVFRAEL